jgi:hypothetical protein
MKYLRYRKAGWLVALMGVALAVSLVTPALAANNAARMAARGGEHAAGSGSTAVAATIYVTTGTLQPMFESNLRQQLPIAFNNAIASMVNRLPKQDQGWAAQMAATLIQPSATLDSLTPQANGMLTTLTLSLYPGDPKAINASLLVTFSVLDSSTIQVSAAPVSGSPTLVSGPLSTFHIPIGALNAVAATPACGDSALGINLQFPINLGQGQAMFSAPGAATLHPGSAIPLASTLPGTQTTGAADVNSFVEIPASSLALVGNNMGSLPVGNFSAQNIRIGVQGSNLVTTSDIFWGGLNIGTAVTTIAPGTANGSLVVHVQNTVLHLFGIFSFPMNSYNLQIEQTLNAQLNSALAGKFTVTNAAIGASAQVP